MLCDECGARPASVHITKIVNNKKTQLNLCDKCASEYQYQLGGFLEPNFSLNKFLASLLEYDQSFGSKTQSPPSSAKCPQCGQHYTQFAQSGKLGCEGCYEVFGESMDPLLKRVHGSQIHKGKYPKRTGDAVRLKRELQQYKALLNELVIKEEFEKAAEIRDKIRDMEKDLGTGKGANKNEH